MVSLWSNRCGVAALLLLTVLRATPAHAACDDILPDPPKPVSAVRSVTADDLLRLRDIGQPDGAMVAQPSPLAISPDGRTLAFFISRADPTTNGYCRALVAIDLVGAARQRILDRGGDLITSVVASRGVLIGNGLAAPVMPHWSPDGRWLAYLRRDHGVTQVWRTRANGQSGAQVTHSAVGVVAVAWTNEGKLAVMSVPGQIASDRAIDADGLSGWLYEARVVPNIAARPRSPATLATQVDIVDPDTGASVLANASEQALVAPPDLYGIPVPPVALTTDGRRAWTAHVTASPLSGLKLMASMDADHAVTCGSPTCRGAIVALWWAADHGSIVFLRREGWANGEMGLYRWIPGSAPPRRILRTEQVLIGCLPNAQRLICTAEASTRPRSIVSVDLRSGRMTSVFDPNPEFASIRLGQVRRLKWKNNLGLEAWGDLVLPPGHRAGGTRLPMVVVQYHSDGFLRGGTGDEFPIFAFAARGVAVLSLERPAFVATLATDLKSFEQINAVSGKDWAERRSLLSSIETGVALAVSTGDIDDSRIGVTGLSDGASSARFALVNTRLFAAASISSCCVDTRTAMTYGGIGMADSFRAIGWPPSSAVDMTFWRPYSMTLAADKMRTPLLMQLADDEYLLGLETFTALREHHQPVEMFVFPDEHHLKWQPAHRRAVYERNLDWFDYWLRNERDPAPGKRTQYDRWDKLRAEQPVARQP